VLLMHSPSSREEIAEDVGQTTSFESLVDLLQAMERCHLWSGIYTIWREDRR
jgi:hypothetical protein